MMVDGKHFGDASNTCYIPIFKHGLSQTTDDTKRIWIGNTFVQAYYVIYDMSQLDKLKYL
jgi:hypothetical protein